MISGIVYESNTGFTKQYAEMLGSRLNLPVLPVAKTGKTIPRGSDVFFFGWVCGGKVMGLSTAAKRFAVKGVGAVGILYPTMELFNELLKTNKIPGPLFYLQGGVDPKKLSGFKRKILSMIARNLEMHQAKTEADWKLVDALQKGGSFVNGLYVEPIIKWLTAEESKAAANSSENSSL